MFSILTFLPRFWHAMSALQESKMLEIPTIGLVLLPSSV